MWVTVTWETISSHTRLSPPPISCPPAPLPACPPAPGEEYFLQLCAEAERLRIYFLNETTHGTGRGGLSEGALVFLGNLQAAGSKGLVQAEGGDTPGLTLPLTSSCVTLPVTQTQASQVPVALRSGLPGGICVGDDPGGDVHRREGSEQAPQSLSITGTLGKCRSQCGRPDGT